jgi:cytoskeletal protein RodZ
MEEIVIQPAHTPAVTSEPMSRTSSAAISNSTGRTTQTTTGIGGEATADEPGPSDEENALGVSTTNEDTDDGEIALPFDYGFDVDDEVTTAEVGVEAGPSTVSETTKETTEAGTQRHVVITLGNEESFEVKKKRIAMENRK